MRITEYLDVDVNKELWICNRCEAVIAPANKSYKEGCLIAERDPLEIYDPIVKDQEYCFAPDPNFCSIIEFYCPNCSVLLETEYLPPGHPLTVDIELDLDALKKKYREKE